MACVQGVVIRANTKLSEEKKKRERRNYIEINKKTMLTVSGVEG